LTKIISATQARANLYALLADVNTHHDPVTITGTNGNAILIAEHDWDAINATLELHAVPGLVVDIAAGRNKPFDTDPLDW
jgi:antitoxin YefM